MTRAAICRNLGMYFPLTVTGAVARLRHLSIRATHENRSPELADSQWLYGDGALGVRAVHGGVVPAGRRMMTTNAFAANGC